MPAADAFPVLFVNAGAERGGAEAVLVTLLRHLDRRRFPPHVCCLREGPFVDELRRDARVDVTVVPSGAFRQVARGLAAVRRIHALVSELGVALVHANGTGGHIYGGLAAARAGVPHLYHAHDVPESGWNGQGFIGRLARLVRADVTVAPSRFLAGRLAQSPVRSARIVHVPNGLDAPDAPRHPAELKFGPTTDRTDLDRPPVAVWCGRLQRWKGAHVFLRAAAIARQSIPSAQFVIVGGTLMGLEPDHASDLRTLARTLGLESAVRFAGQQADVWSFLQAADVVVHSSVSPEPFGLVILEAMLAGRAVIASAAGGPLEIVEPGATGLLVPPGDATALGAALVRLLGDPAAASRMGREGRRRAERYFSAAAMTTRIEALYNEVLARRRGEAA
jgi:glycosyltransferase involved in cell wall biosynthesis